MLTSTAFTCPPSALKLPQPKPISLPSHYAPRKRQPRTTTATLRRDLRIQSNPNAGIGGTPCFIRSTRHPSLNLFTLTWPACTPPIAGVIISPGLVWHSGWFSSVAQALSAAGCTTVALDNLSMGRSDNLRGKKGLVMSIDDHVVELREALLRLERDLPPGTPLFVLGESSGGLTAVLLALDEVAAPRLRGYVLCAPAIRIREELLPPRAVMEVVKVLGRVFPGLSTPGESVSGETWDEAFGDKRCAEISKQDPLVGYGEPVWMGTAASFMAGMEQVENTLQRGELRMRDVLVLHNRADVRTDFVTSERFVQRVVCDGNATLVELGGPGHQLFQDKPDVTQDVIKRVVEFIVETAQAGVSGRS